MKGRGLMLLLLAAAALPAFAAEEQSFTVANYNVAGLPKLFGNPAEDVAKNQAKIGEILAERHYDLLAVQEDFGEHAALSALLKGYPHTTHHTGSAPGGDGMNLWSDLPLFNETRIPWQTAYGVIADGADEMTPKGILYAVIQLDEGVYVDFYNLHADAYGDDGSIAARRDQFIQLAAVMEEKSAGRPVIVTGDFNTSLSRSAPCGLWENLMEPLGLTDVWIELYNGGNTADFSAHFDSPEKWDSIEKFLYRDGGGIDLTPTAFSYEYLTDEEGGALSDHPAAIAAFTWSKTEDFAEYTGELADSPGFFAAIGRFFAGIANKIAFIFTDLWKILANWQELVEYLGG